MERGAHTPRSLHLPPPMLEPDFIARFTTHLREALQHALEFAVRSGRELVAPGDLLVGLLHEKGSIGTELLMKAGITLEAAERAFRGTPDANPKGETLTPDLSVPVKRILERCILTAHLHEHKYVGTEHLVGALLAIDLPDVARFLSSSGASAEQLKEHVGNILTSTSRFPDIAVPHLSLEEDVGEAAAQKAQTVPRPGRMPSALEAFSRELTEQATAEQLDPVIGRERELERVVEILCRRTKNNPILLGEPGVGKTAIVEGLAKLLAAGDVPDALHGKRLLSVDLALTVAGTMYRGEFEARLKQLVDEVKTDQNIILFIDEVHNIVGAGSTSGSLDAANILKPALARGDIRCIGATTWGEYKKFIEADAALERRFQPVSIEEPSAMQARAMLEGLRERYARHHGVSYDDDALDAAVYMAERYMTDRMFPDKAIDLIDEAAASVVAARRNHEVMERLRTLEAARSATGLAKEEAVSQERMDEAAAFKREEDALNTEWEHLRSSLEQKRDDHAPRVTVRDVASVVARIANIPVETILATERERMKDLDIRLGAAIIGQTRAVADVADAVRKARLGLNDQRRPKISMLFAGPSGTGKTEMARTLAEELFGRKDALLKLDMSEFAEGFSASKLLGSPAGYVGYRESNRFTDAVRKRPHCVVCFDEIEKAHPEVLNLLLQLLEDGQVTDSTGRPVSFRQSYIILTSNVGADSLGKKTLGFGDASGHGSAFEALVRSDIEERFRPELLNRLDRVVVFQPLQEAHLKEIIRRELELALERVRQAQRVACTAGDDVLDWLLTRPIPEKEGARAARRLVECEITNLVGNLLSRQPGKRKITLKITKKGLQAL
ncbi:ATP-dependent Clp protease ATP-binding subunit [Candidatus Uhrbacteria bacterium UHB]|nr:ATP-dependent Clp protease ATP-binding subunit [Candidatus Uhrbacteria bacterium UHB]RIL00578.1 MAG: ATP-dependent Clp protease ATP-binding subunit ClpC [Candidatus Uhrbacteria bacterium]